jgi:threonine synthase
MPTTTSRAWRGVIEEFRDRLPVTAATPVLTLGEGGTPLVRAEHLSELTGCDVHVKVEGANPTGSFKDRGMAVAIAKAMEEGATAVICASTGNTSASAAAYAAKAGLTCVVLVPKGRIATGKMAQAVVHAARILQVEGGFDDCLRLARALADTFPVSLVNSVNDFRVEGQKTAALEIVDALGRAPDVHALPVGNAGNVTAYWRGYRESGPQRPRMWGYQAEGAAPIVLGHRVEHPDTLASAIRIGDPASWHGAVAARDESGGRIDLVTDAQIIAAQRLLAAREGIFVEPASAASVAGLLQTHAAGELDAGQVVVVTVTGNGLKDVETALSGIAIDPLVIPADVDAAAAALGL